MLLAEMIEQATEAHAAPLAGTRDAAAAGLEAVGRLRAWCDSIEVELGRVMAATASFPEQAIGEPLGLNDRHGQRVLRRVRTCDEVPEFERSLAAGRVSGAHVDSVGAALAKIEPEHRAALADAAGRLVGVAENGTLEAFRTRLSAEARRLRTDGGLQLLDRQRRDVRMRTWVNKRTGMWHLAGSFDPENGVIIDAALRSVLDALYSDTIPETAPADPLERQDYLRALAFVHLVTNGGGTISIDIVPVVDLTQPADGSGLNINWGIPVELPDEILRRWWPQATINPVVLDSGAIVHAPGILDLFRTTRLATKAQRRALRARHRTCGIPGCSVAFDNCWIHHVIWWRNGGYTNLDNLVPVCTRHHGQIHAGEIDITLTPDRQVLVTHHANAPPTTAQAA